MQPASRLGHYEIVAPLGAGGMGEVYRARDVRLGRDVAIKILSASFGAASGRRDRFEREARIISSLNHPNICALYDIGHEGEHDFLVLEYLDGEPLDHRLAASRGRPLPTRQALQIGVQIADALDKAHRAGVVHRDLKPQNIFLTRHGAKLLDFGLAKLAAPPSPPATQIEPTAVAPGAGELTMDGTIVGTFLYMAPEQLAGRDADVRTDIYAFGLVMYEMLTGRRPFEDRADTGVITAVFEREPPPLNTVVSGLPASVDRIVRTCLAKDPDDRFQSAHDVLLQLRWAFEPPSDAATADAVTRTVRWWRFAAIASLAASAVIAARLLAPREAPPAPVVRYAHVIPADQIFTRAGRRPLAISPDGTRLIYAANGQILMKSADSLDASPIQGTDDDPSDPSFSPSGNAIMYWSRRTGDVRRVSVTGGDSTSVARTLNPWGSSWAGNRLFVSEGRNGILEVPANGGRAHRVVAAADGEWLYGPELLPDGDTLIFTAKPATTSRWDDAAIVAQSISTGARKVLVQGGTDAHVAPSALVYVHDATIMGVRFDAQRVEVTGTPVELVAGVAEASANITGAAYYSFSKTGTLVYVPGDTGARRTIVLVDRSGRETPLAAPPKPYVRARLSPDGTRLALDVRALDGDVWVWDMNRDVITRLTSSRADERNAMWIDGHRLAYASEVDGGSGIFLLAADGTGTPEQIHASKDIEAPVSISPDGRTLVLFQLKSGTALYDIKSMRLDEDRTPRPMFTLPFADPSVVFSPDGRWVAYASNESGRSEVYVQRFPTQNEAPVQISKDGGATPIWRRDGREILFVDRNRRMTAVDVQAGASFSAGEPQPLFNANYFTLPLGRPFDVSGDGQRFVMIKDAQPSQQFVFVQHWFDEVARRLR